ncbi:MAG: DUF3106 domain-containing protein [Verrucomicrobia bacterium]|nr:DUF3106 domain-containing protein [Verrucomicrobiota bacterium]
MTRNVHLKMSRGLTWLVALMGFGALISSSLGQNSGRAPVPGGQAEVNAPLPPVEFFRQLLAMDPLDQERALAERPLEKREALKAKIAEYSKMPASEREWRLRMTELRYYLAPLMKRSRGDRIALLAEVPHHLRELVSERLDQWDLLPEPFQKEVLDQEFMLHYFARLESSSPAERERILSTMSSERRDLLERELGKWRDTPVAERGRMYERFNQFFELPAQEKEKTLDRLSDEEQRQMEKALQRFGQLPARQRELFIESFQKFASMSNGERDQFFENAERWKVMSPKERQTWRNLINLLPVQSEPPLPGGVQTGAASPAVPPGASGGSAAGKLPALPGR